MRRLRLILPALVALSMIVVACGHDDDEVYLPEAEGRLEERGRTLVQVAACTNCHSADGKKSVGPTWEGLAGSEVELEGGDTVIADDEYLRESITDPKAKIVKGYPPVMPASTFEPDDLDAIVAYLRQLGDS